MKEYEYSFKVSNLKPYLDYCERNGFIKEKDVKQTRDLFTNNSGVIARITVSKSCNVEDVSIDFKGEDDSDKVLKNTRESLPLNINKSNIKAFYTILDILGYSKIKHLVRKRVVYKKEEVKFEIDKYYSPEVMNVVAIEGKKSVVDKIYKDVCKKIGGSNDC